jgi:hypothetical protein
MDTKKRNEYQLKLYHKNKNNPNSSCYLPKRLEYQRYLYKLKKGKVKNYHTKHNKVKDLKINNGKYIIEFS